MSFNETITLSNGTAIPQIGLGTWLSKPHEVENAVEIAVRNGYRHLDLALVYGNQAEIGNALKKVIPSVVKREELFITSKLWNNAHQPNEVAKQLDETLGQLGIGYLDLYLVHWPVAFPPNKGSLFPPHPKIKGEVEIDTETSLVDTWKAMIDLPKEKVRAIGVSNYTIEQMEAIIDATGVAPAVNQIEAHPLLPQDDLVAYCKKKTIHITAYSPLGNNMANKPKLTEHLSVISVAEGLNATPAQVLIAWGVHRGYSVIPKSVQESRILSNFKQVKLSEKDYKAVGEIGVGDHTRFNIPVGYTPKWDIDVFGEPEEKGASFKPKLR